MQYVPHLPSTTADNPQEQLNNVLTIPNNPHSLSTTRKPIHHHGFSAMLTKPQALSRVCHNCILPSFLGPSVCSTGDGAAQATLHKQNRLVMD